MPLLTVLELANAVSGSPLEQAKTGTVKAAISVARRPIDSTLIRSSSGVLP